MSPDQSKFLLVLTLGALVLLLVSNGKRITAETPIDGDDAVGVSQTPLDMGDVAPGWAANNPQQMPMPLAMMIPNTGNQPAGECQ